MPDWVRDGVIYEIYPRAFSQQGNFNAITARLDELKDLGVTILWLMPIHPIGQEKKKGTIGSPYAVRDYYGINPDYGTADDLHRLVREAHARGLKVIIASGYTNPADLPVGVSTLVKPFDLRQLRKVLES